MTDPIIKRVVDAIEGDAPGTVRASVVVSTPRHLQGAPPGLKGVDLDTVRMAMKKRDVKAQKLVVSGFEFEAKTNTMDAVKMFFRDSHLTHVSFAHSKVGDDQGVALMTAVAKQGCHIEALNLSNTGIGGIFAARSARLLEPVHVHLRTLNVSFNPITAQGLGLLLKWACGLSEIDASFCGILTQRSITSRRKAMEYLEEGLRENISCHTVRLVGNGVSELERVILDKVVQHNVRSSLHPPMPGILYDEEGAVSFVSPGAQEKMDVLQDHMVYMNALETAKLEEMGLNSSGGFVFDDLNHLDLEDYAPEDEGGQSEAPVVRAAIETIQSQRKLDIDGGDSLGPQRPNGAVPKVPGAEGGSPKSPRRAKSSKSFKKGATARKGSPVSPSAAGNSDSPGPPKLKPSRKRVASPQSNALTAEEKKWVTPEYDPLTANVTNSDLRHLTPGSSQLQDPVGEGADVDVPVDQMVDSEDDPDDASPAPLMVERATSYGGALRMRKQRQEEDPATLASRSKSMRVRGSAKLYSKQDTEFVPRQSEQKPSPTTPRRARALTADGVTRGRSYTDKRPQQLDPSSDASDKSSRTSEEANEEDTRPIVLAGKRRGKAPQHLIGGGPRTRSAPGPRDKRRGTVPQQREETINFRKNFERSTYSSTQKYHADDQPEMAKLVEGWHKALAHGSSDTLCRQLSTDGRHSQSNLNTTPVDFDLCESRLPHYMASTTASRHRKMKDEVEECTDILELRSRRTPTKPPGEPQADSPRASPRPSPRRAPNAQSRSRSAHAAPSIHVVQTTASWRGKYEAKPRGQGWVPVRDDETSGAWRTNPQKWPDRPTRDPSTSRAGSGAGGLCLPHGDIGAPASSKRHGAPAGGAKDRQTPAILNACLAGNAICQQLLGCEVAAELPHGCGGGCGVPLAFIAHSGMPDALNELPLGSVERVGGMVKLLHFIAQIPMTKVDTGSTKGVHQVRYLPGIPAHLETEDEVIDYVTMLASKHKSRRYEMLSQQPKFAGLRAEENRMARTLLRQHRKLEAGVGRECRQARARAANHYNRSFSVGATPTSTPRSVAGSPGRASNASRSYPRSASVSGDPLSGTLDSHVHASGARTPRASTASSSNIAMRRPWGQNVKVNPQKRPWGGAAPEPVDVRLHVSEYMQRPERIAHRMQVAMGSGVGLDAPRPGQQAWCPVPLSQAAVHYGSGSQSARSHSLSNRGTSVSPLPDASAPHTMNGTGIVESFRVHTSASRRKASEKTLPISSMHWYRRSKSHHR
eukprot:TRINITY_DN24876_c0_g1_i1.p1 TRINITY_DN24876_c0_g1~~TRINITY_DN24876_c0_g1_i1.p1  ORF type:complete len:1263 (+),score=280.92 TRINITY_DN24876_c0_g1_i1:81-3869(+)